MTEASNLEPAAAQGWDTEKELARLEDNAVKTNKAASK